MTNPIFLPLAFVLAVISVVVFVRGIARFFRPLMGLLILAMAIWYVTYLVQTAQVVVLVQPSGPAFYTTGFIFIMLLWYGIHLVHGGEKK